MSRIYYDRYLPSDYARRLVTSHGVKKAEEMTARGAAKFGKDHAGFWPAAYDTTQTIKYSGKYSKMNPKGKFLSTKFYPVNTDSRTIINDPMRRERDVAYKYKGQHVIGLPGKILNAHAVYAREYKLIEVNPKRRKRVNPRTRHKSHRKLWSARRVAKKLRKYIGIARASNRARRTSKKAR